MITTAWSIRRALGFNLVFAVSLFLLEAGTMAAAPQASDEFIYMCTATPVTPGKVLKAVAEGDDGTSVSGTATTPGGKYYNITLTLSKGVNYSVKYELDGAMMSDKDEVFHPRNTPSLLRNREMFLDRNPLIKKGPDGMVLLTAKTVNQGFDATAPHLVDVVPGEGGSWSRSTKDAKAGTAFVFVKPGQTYTVRYYVDGKLYEHTGLIAASERSPAWTLEDKGRKKVPCTYTYGPWGKCLGGKKYREVRSATPDDCDGVIAAVLDTVCTLPSGRDTASHDPRDPNCVYGQPKWDIPCVAGEIQHGTMEGTPASCGTRDTTRTCPPAPPGPIGGFTPQGFDNDPHRELDVCEIWQVLAITKLKTEWKLKETDRVTVEIRPIVFNGNVNAGGNDTSSVRKDLIAVNDSVFLELISEDSSFKITPGRGNLHKYAYGSLGVKFDWSLTAVKAPEDGKAKLVLIPWTIDCSSGKMTAGSDVPYEVTVDVSIGDWIDRLLSWLEKNLTRIAGILALVAGIVGYFKGWFGGFLKRKEKKEEGQA